MTPLVEEKKRVTPRVRPIIIGEEDVPMSGSSDEGGGTSFCGNIQYGDLNATKEIKEQEHGHIIDDFKHKLARFLIFACLCAVVVFAAADAICHVESSMFVSAFDTFKTIALTALGFVFGAKATK